MAKFSKENFIKSGKIAVEVEIELPVTDEKGNLKNEKGTVTVHPLTNRQVNMINTAHKDNQEMIGYQMINEGIPDLCISFDEYKTLGSGTTATLLAKINEVSGLDKEYLKTKNF